MGQENVKRLFILHASLSENLNNRTICMKVQGISCVNILKDSSIQEIITYRKYLNFCYKQ